LYTNSSIDFTKNEPFEDSERYGPKPEIIVLSDFSDDTAIGRTLTTKSDQNECKIAEDESIEEFYGKVIMKYRESKTTNHEFGEITCAGILDTFVIRHKKYATI